MTKRKEVETPYSNYSIAAIAATIKKEWKNVNYAAKPYLDAMFSLTSARDKYGADSGESIIAYFLANARSFTGSVAKEIKKELNARIK